MEGVGFVRAGERIGDNTAAAAAAAPLSQPAAGSGVVILAPKHSHARAPSDALTSNILGIRRVLKQRAAAASGRAVSPDSPPAGRRRASPTYEVFQPRGSPSYEPAAKPRSSPSYEQQPRSAAAAGDTCAGAAKSTASRSRSRSRSRSKSRSRSRSRHKSRQRKSSKHYSRHSKRSRSRSRSRHRSSRYRRSRSRSRGRSPATRHRHNSSKHSSRRSSQRSRSRSTGRRRSRSRSRGDSPPRFTAYERERARADERAHAAPMRRGRQGLGFGQSAAATALGQQLQPSARDKESGSRGGGAGGKAGSVSVLDAAAHIPGHATMSAAERMKARMRLVMAKAEQQGTAAEAAEDGSAGAGAGAVVGEGGWTRFVFDKHGALDEDKLARQRLMDAEVAAGVSGSSAAVGASVEEAGAAFVMGTGRAAARRAATLITAQEQHEAAIFGRLYGGSSSACDGGAGGAVAAAESQAAADGGGQLAASLGVADGLLSGQQLSWRERLALKKQQQQ